MSSTEMRNLFLLPLFLLIVLVSGCATAPQEPELSRQMKEQLRDVRMKELEAVSHWQMTGRLGLRVPGQSGSMSVEWLQNQQDYTIYLDGPLGKSLAKIESSVGEIQVEASGQKYTGQSPEILLYEITGWQLPVSFLRYWVQGMPVPGAPGTTMELDNHGQLVQLQQAGWTVEYLEYQKPSTVSLPRRMRVTKDNIQMTLVARSWQLE